MIRIGHGIDVHAFDATRPLVLGGVRISESGGLSGHSDADAVLHSITDAILGALGDGDIGEYFPSNDTRWGGADSRVFVREALNRLQARGGMVVNLDVTIIAQQPKLSPHRAAVRASVAAILGVRDDRVNVKATTTDGLGFIGRAEGLAVASVICIELPDED